MNRSSRQGQRTAANSAVFEVKLPNGIVRSVLPLDWPRYRPLKVGESLAIGDYVITAGGNGYRLCSGFFGTVALDHFKVGAKGERCQVGYYWRREGKGRA